MLVAFSYLSRYSRHEVPKPFPDCMTATHYAAGGKGRVSHDKAWDVSLCSANLCVRRQEHVSCPCKRKGKEEPIAPALSKARPEIREHR